MSLRKCIAAAALAAVGGIATDCSTAPSHYKLSNLTILPDPPVQGSPALMAAMGTVDEAVTGGKSSLSVYLDNFNIYQAAATTCGNTTINLPLGMGTILIDNFACPTTAAEAQNVSMSLTLPSGIPSGTYNIILTALDQNSAPVYCLNATFNE